MAMGQRSRLCRSVHRTARRLRSPLGRRSQKAPAQVGIYEKRYFAFQQIMIRWRTSTELFARSVPLQYNSPPQHRNSAQSVLCFGSCIETPCNPKRSPLSEMTCPASATAVFSLLPVPRRIASNSALDSASGPSDNSRSRGLSSGGSCLMVYLRVPTVVFYIIQASGYRISALRHVSEVGLQVSTSRMGSTRA
jgi:hypothetical protein